MFNASDSNKISTRKETAWQELKIVGPNRQTLFLLLQPHTALIYLQQMALQGYFPYHLVPQPGFELTAVDLY